MKGKNRLKAILAERNILVKDFRQQLEHFTGEKIGASTVSRWINNKQQPYLDTFYDIAAMLDLDIFDMFVSIKDLDLFEVKEPTTRRSKNLKLTTPTPSDEIEEEEFDENKFLKKVGENIGTIPRSELKSKPVKLNKRAERFRSALEKNAELKAIEKELNLDLDKTGLSMDIIEKIKDLSQKAITQKVQNLLDNNQITNDDTWSSIIGKLTANIE